VTDIVRTAVLGCYGVAGFATPNPWDHLVRRLGLGEPGIRLDLEDLAVELRLRVAYGLPIAEVARQVESAVRYALGRDLGREPREVTIHVDGLVEREPGMVGAPDPGARGRRRDDEAADVPAVPSPTTTGPARPPTGTPARDSGAPPHEADTAEPGARR
jgi:uncharacterized alkaline shock family protein YloU